MHRSHQAVLAFFLSLVVSVPSARGQVRPDLQWRTLDSPHFRVHFSPGLGPLALRTVRNAEEAYQRLSEVLVPPRGVIDIVVADNVDFANGYATVFPTNRIVVYARPPMEELTLRNHEDWNRILVTHELTHIFHLDRAKGWWGVAQQIFGRAAPLFPNTYAPAWITEGLAVQMESRFSHSGRLNGSEFPAYVRAAALVGDLPPLDAASLAAPRFPGPSTAYIYGAYAMDHRGPLELKTYVEYASARIFPWRHDANAKAAFGETFSMQWERWRDSVLRASIEGGVVEAARARAAAVEVDELTRHSWEARYPRFTSDSTLVYVANDGRRTTGLYSLTLSGERHRIGRRAGLDAPAWLADGTSLQAELEYTDLYTLRSDLTSGSGITRRRITSGERLSHPDVHAASGRVVALKTEEGTTSIVEASAEDAFPPRPIAQGTLDRAWADPRWSRAGDRVVAVRWDRGGRSSVVVMDLRGQELRAFSPSSSRFTVVSSPAWEPGDTTVLFVSDHEGRAMIYRGDVRTGAYVLVWSTATALHTPDVSPDGRRLVAVELHEDGFRVVTRLAPATIPVELPPADTASDRRDGPLPPEPTASEPSDTLGAKYSPGKSLRPSWWLPVVVATGTGSLSVGARSSGRDVIGQHAYAVAVSNEFENSEQSLDGIFSFSGLGNPLFTTQASMDWDHATIYNNTGNRVGYLARRTLRAAGTAVLQRQRVRWGAYLLGGGEYEQVEHRTYPPSLLSLLNTPSLEQRQINTALIVAAGVGTMQHAQVSVSPSDGFDLDVQHRALGDAGINDEKIGETIVSTTVAKSLPLPGFARHVVAVRAAYATTGHAAQGGFSAGGVSGTSLEVIPGVVIGSSRRTFGVRGFDPGAQVGVRAAAMSFEYRAPLTLLGRGVKLLPVYFQKASVIGFADVGAAWCARLVTDSFLCDTPNPERVWMQSVGAEIVLDASIHYDQIYRFRFGVAHPTRGLGFRSQENTVYFSLGAQF